MMNELFEFVTHFPPWLATILISMVPVFELRVAIPLAIGVFKLSPWFAFLLAIIGDLVPAIAIVCFIKPVSIWLSARSKFIKKILDWWFLRTINNFEKKYIHYGAWALAIFVAIPLPVFGSWTGAVAAFLFGITKRRALFFISLGTVVAAAIVTLVSVGAFSIF